MTNYHSSVKDEAVLDYAKSAMAAPMPDVVSVLAVDGDLSLGMDPDWLKAELERPGRSQSALARFLGLAPEQVNRMVHRRRKITADEAEKIRAYLTGSGNGATFSRMSPKPVEALGLPIRGTVEAGSWREVALSDLNLEPETLPAPRSIVDSGAFALRVSGPSMNLKYPDGSYVVVQPWHGGRFPVGRRVVVERIRPDGLVETTVKELVQRADGEYELWPRSDHPSHQTPISLTDAEDVNVRIIGMVVWSMAPD